MRRLLSRALDTLLSRENNAPETSGAPTAQESGIARRLVDDGEGAAESPEGSASPPTSRRLGASAAATLACRWAHGCNC